MSQTTPTKTLESQGSLVPVWYSPPYKTKSVTSDSNVAACKARLDAIVKTTLENFHKWRLADKRGLQLCTNIEAIKTKVLEQWQNSTAAIPEDFTLYPKSIKQYCDNLEILSTICKDIANKTYDSVRQLNALSRLPESCNEVFYRSWQMPQFIEFLEELAVKYNKESQVKKDIAENLPHCTSRSDLIRWTCLWEYPQYVDVSVNVMFLYFKEELNIKSE